LPTENGVKVVVGSVLHPMDPDHHIEWIQVIADDKAYREFLEPGDDPEAAVEKHVPVVEPTENGVKVVVGSVLHPMDPDHHIEWIQVIADDKAYREFLEPGDDPEAAFDIEAEDIVARAYCDLHGLWKAT
jgi:superoxide reductase